MGSGTTTLLLYAACCGGVAFVGITAAGLYVWGRRAERRKRRPRPPG